MEQYFQRGYEECRSKCDIDRNRPDIVMKLHSYAINSAHVDSLYSGNKCLESIKKQNHIIDGH